MGRKPKVKGNPEKTPPVEPGELTPAQRTLRARLAAHTLHSRYDSRELTANARKTFVSKFERDVDPDGILSPKERARRAEHARKAHFTKLAMLSAAARKARAKGKASM